MGELNGAKGTNPYSIVPQVDEANGQASQGTNDVNTQSILRVSHILSDTVVT